MLSHHSFRCQATTLRVAAVSTAEVLDLFLTAIFLPATDMPNRYICRHWPERNSLSSYQVILLRTQIIYCDLQARNHFLPFFFLALVNPLYCLTGAVDILLLFCQRVTRLILTSAGQFFESSNFAISVRNLRGTGFSNFDSTETVASILVNSNPNFRASSTGRLYCARRALFRSSR